MQTAVTTVQPVAVVQCAVLNLRSGPGTGFAIAGKRLVATQDVPAEQFPALP